MTRSARDRILKDANGDIGDHLRNHIHLTNCIHLKNHMHKHSPIMSDRSLVKELIVLQRSRSLKDPSASPPSWLSPSVIDLLSGRHEKDNVMVNGRRSVGMDGGSGGSPLLGSLRRAEGGSGEVAARTDRSAAVSSRSNKGGNQVHRRNKREESSKTDLGTGSKGTNDDHAQASDDLAHNVVSTNPGLKDKKVKQKGPMQYREDSQLKTLSEQLKEVRMNSEDDKSSHHHFHGKQNEFEQTREVEASARGHGNGVNRVKRRKFRGTRRTRPIRGSTDFGPKNEISVASNSFAQNSARQRYEGEEEYDEQNVTRAPKNGCGIPWNWSRIHHSGRSFLDIAGRSLSCGLSETKLRKDGTGMPVMSDYSSSSTKSDAEATPLLMEGSGSQGSSGNAAWVHDYSGELGIYADNLLKYEIDSDLVSEARSGDQHKFKRSGNSRHQSLTQKYMPRTFRDLVGQHLVAQALSNAVSRKKVGLLYVFYGPHGTGKTSSARVFSKALNCLSLEHPKPCGACNSCVAYETGKSRNIREVGPLTNFDSERIMDLLDNMVVSHQPSQYRVFIFDDCDTLSPDCWSAISKVIDRAPKRVVFILVSSSLDVVPHIIISRCQKFFLPKLKDADIIYALQWIATREELEIDRDALKLIATRSDGSLRDAEMTLEQLSLIGQRISVPLVQELVGLISDEKLVDLLDLALSADTVNTVKHLREIMESGVEPLALMSQLATVITDILAGSYDLTKARSRRKFFRKQTLSKEDMERLRQALKTLSEAEKQLRLSNDRLTWLTAALLQLAPDQQYMLPSSSAETSIHHTPLVQSNTGGRERPRKSNGERSNIGRGLNSTNSTRHSHAADLNQTSDRPSSERAHKGIEEIWLEVLDNIRIGSIKEFMYREGKLISLSFGGAPTVQLMFNSHLAKSKAEKYREHILQAFESVLGSPVTIEIRCENRKDERDGSSSNQAQLLHSKSLRRGKSEIVEVVMSPGEPKGREVEDNSNNKSLPTGALPEKRKLGEQNHSMSLVRGKVSLAHVIQQAEGYHRDGWSRRKAVSIAEKLEQENLKLEPRSRSLLCWKATRVTRRKLSRLKIRTRRPQTLMKFVSCGGKCLSSKSPR